MDVSAHALRYFLAVSEERHFGRAAARLHLTSPSLSEQVSRMEKRLQATLFVRTSRGVELTDAARQLLPLARAVVEAHDAVTLWAAGRTTAQAGTVRVGVFAAAGDLVRSAVLAALSERHPDLEVLTRRTGRQEAIAALRDGRLDVAYLPEPLPVELPGIRWLTVTRQPRMLVVPITHPLAARDSVGIEETNDEVFITFAGTDPVAVAWWLVDPRADGSHPRRGPRVSDVDELLDLCAAGRGIGYCAAAAVRHYTRPGVRFLPLRDVEDARTALCWRADERDPAVHMYVATARRLAGAEAG